MTSALHASGELLAQVRPAVTTAVTLFTAGTLRTEVTLLIAAVTPGSGNNIAVEIYHDDDGTTYDNTTLIGTITNAESAEDTVFQAQHPGSGIHIKPGGSLGVKISTANAVNFSVYGITETTAERIRGVGGISG